MAVVAIRLRRAFSLSSTAPLVRVFSTTAPSSRPPSYSALSPISTYSSPLGSRQVHIPSTAARYILARCRTSGSGYSSVDSDGGRPTILFEGCDYEHWLITMEFPNDPKPTRDEMIDTFVKTLANVVGSVEEAKKRIYSVCTTTYVGFQARISEELSEKMKEQPGVVWVLPDSYIDPVNKEYGGDKYDNGVITPRPRPQIQQGRYNDRPRNYDRPRFDRRRDSMPIERRDPGPMPQGDRRDPMPMDGRYNPQGDRRDYGRDNMQGERRDYRPMDGRDGMQGYRPIEGRDNMQAQRRDYGAPEQGERRDYSAPPPPPVDRREPVQEERRGYSPPPPPPVDGRDPLQGDRRDYVPPPSVDRREPMQAEGRGYAPPPPVDRPEPMQGGRMDYSSPPPVDRTEPMQEGRVDYAPPPPVDRREPMQGEGRDSAPPPAVDRTEPVQEERRDSVPPPPVNNTEPVQGERRDYVPPFTMDRREPGQGERRRNYIPAHERLAAAPVPRRDSARIEERFALHGEFKDSVPAE